MIKDLTILLLLKDGSPFTWRWMDYYNKIGLSCKVIIADGGKDTSVEKLADTSLFPNIDYKYIRYPHDKDLTIFFQKTCDVLSRITTKYVLLASNDDFYVPESLSTAIKFLNENNDYVVARGDIYSFQIKPFGKEEEEEDVYGEMTSWVKLYTNKSNEASTALERVRTSIEYSNSLWHDVCRTDTLRQCYTTLLESGILDLDLSERLINYLLASEGKVHRGEGLHMLHQSRQNGLGHLLISRDPFEWILSEHWPRYVSKLFELTAKKISEKDGGGTELIHYKVMQYFLCFVLGKKMIKERIEREIANMPGRMVRWGRIFSRNNKLRSAIKKIYVEVQDYFQAKRSRQHILQSPYYKDIKQVQDYLAKKY